MLFLIRSNFTTRRVRTALTAAAIGLSVSLVVAVACGYSSGEAAAMAMLNRYLGSADAQITRPQQIADGMVPLNLDAQLSADPDVKHLTARLEVITRLMDKDNKLTERTLHVVGIQRPQDTRIDSLIVQAGEWFPASDGNFAVVDQVAAATLHVDVGEWFSIPSDHGALRLKVVALVHKPDIIAAAVQTIYVPMETLQEFEGVGGKDPQVSEIDIDLRSGANGQAFYDRWTKQLEEMKPAGDTVAPLKLRLVSQDRTSLDSNLRAVHVLTYLGQAVSMLAATFIIFSSLAMGVSERQRMLAMLRAIGATRAQVARMVVGEGLLIALLGAAAGIPLGLLWTEILRLLFRDIFVGGITVSWSGIALAIFGAMGAALMASLLPAWSAARTDPLEAMGQIAQPQPHRPGVLWTLLGLALICIDPLIFILPLERVVNAVHPSDNPEALTTVVRFYAHYAIGAESLFLGFFLIAPLLVWALELLLAPAAGILLRLPKNLLRQQLSGGLWRAAGAAAALMVGLSVLIVMTTTGISMLDGWKLPDKFPDIFLVSLRLGGLSSKQLEQLSQTPGIRHFDDGTPELMPVVVTISGLGSNPLALMGAVIAPNLRGTMFFGVPPKAAFGMMELDFRDNDGKSVPRDQQQVYSDRAVHDLDLGRHVVVSEDYRRRFHVKYGDKIKLVGDKGEYEYTVCGIVWPPGLDVIVAMFDMGRQLEQQTAGMVFGSIDDARRDFGADNVNLLAANLDSGLDKQDLLKNIATRVGDMSMKAGDVRQIKTAIDTEFRRLLAMLTTVAFSAMAVASLGVTNTIMASIRSRRWQLGVLRGIGLCGGELLRLILAEAILLGFVGIALGLGCGLILALDARELSAEVLGYLPRFVIPWGYVWIGTGGVMLVSIGGAIWPAINVSRTEPLKLLQAGRAAA